MTTSRHERAVRAVRQDAPPQRHSQTQRPCWRRTDGWWWAVSWGWRVRIVGSSGRRVPATVPPARARVCARADAASVSGMTRRRSGCSTVEVEIDLLGGVPDPARRALLAAAVRRRFERGEVVFHEGDLADTVHWVVEGRVASRRTTPAGDTVILAVVGPGELVGEMALLSPRARRTTAVVALEPAVTMAVGFGDVDRLRRRHPDLDRLLLDLLAHRVRRLSDHLLDALHVPAGQRVVRRLAELGATYGAGSSGEVVVRLTQSEIGELAGSSRPVTNQVLRRLEEDGLVRLGRGAVTLLDPAGLARRAAS